MGEKIDIISGQCCAFFFQCLLLLMAFLGILTWGWGLVVFIKLCITIFPKWHQHKMGCKWAIFLSFVKTVWHVFLSCWYKEVCNFGYKSHPTNAAISMATPLGSDGSEVQQRWWQTLNCAVWDIFFHLRKGKKERKEYLIAQNSFRSDGESLPIHLNLRGWDTSGPNSHWHSTWLWNQTTWNWKLLLSPEHNREKKNKSFHFLHI